jgi:dihydrofolate reductase
MKPNLKVSVFIATSLDGFIARKNGSIDWLEKASSLAPQGEDCGYHDFFNSTDTLVMGRKTFETVLGFPQWPYENKKVIVLSSTLKTLPINIPPSVELKSGSPLQILNELYEQGSRHVYLDGGVTIQNFLFEKLVDEITLTQIPILLGEGLSLFGKLKEDQNLELISSKAYPFGFVSNKYKLLAAK